MMTKHGPLPERRFWGQVFFGCKPAIQTKSKTHAGCTADHARHCANELVIFHNGGRRYFCKSCSSQSPIDFLNFYFQRRPKETAARLDSNVHTDSGFTPSPVGS